jgi:hypothetical protein
MKFARIIDSLRDNKLNAEGRGDKIQGKGAVEVGGEPQEFDIEGRGRRRSRRTSNGDPLRGRAALGPLRSPHASHQLRRLANRYRNKEAGDPIGIKTAPSGRRRHDFPLPASRPFLAVTSAGGPGRTTAKKR